MIRSEAEYFDGQSANSRVVEIRIIANSLEIRDQLDALVSTWSLELVRDENIPPSATTLFLSLSDTNGARLRIADGLMIEAIRARCPKLSKNRNAGLKPWAVTIAASIAVLLSVVAFVWFGIPYAAEPVAHLIPETVLQDIGKGVEKQIVEKFSKSKNAETSICNEKGAQKTLDRLIADFTRVSASENDQGIPVVTSLIVVDSKMQNAFALPGGRMVIFSGLLDIAEDPNALIGVLAHEFAHVKERHPTRLMVANVGMAALLSVALGDVSGGTVIAAVGQMALGASYSRDMETSADVEAMQIMNTLGYDMKPMIPLLKELAKKQGGGVMFDLMNTHPGIEDRIAIIEQQPDAAFTRAMSKSDWASLKTICKGSV